MSMEPITEEWLIETLGQIRDEIATVGTKMLTARHREAGEFSPYPPVETMGPPQRIHLWWLTDELQLWRAEQIWPDRPEVTVVGDDTVRGIELSLDDRDRTNGRIYGVQQELREALGYADAGPRKQRVLREQTQFAIWSCVCHLGKWYKRIEMDAGDAGISYGRASHTSTWREATAHQHKAFNQATAQQRSIQQEQAAQQRALVAAIVTGHEEL